MRSKLNQSLYAIGIGIVWGGLTYPLFVVLGALGEITGYEYEIYSLVEWTYSPTLFMVKFIGSAYPEYTYLLPLPVYLLQWAMTGLLFLWGIKLLRKALRELSETFDLAKRAS